MKLLVVDDDDIVLSLVAATVKKFGHDPVPAPSAREALRLWREQRIRMIISDWMMPEMSGVDLCRAIREEDVDWYTYIILLTGRDMGSSLLEGLSAGADEFIHKPFDPSELALRISTGVRILSIETQHVAIFAMAKLTESRDPETGRHLERIREYTRLLAKQMAAMGVESETLTPEFIRTLYHTSPLHDIGKVGIPDAILLKPGRLSDDEFQAMKLHSVIGGETLRSAASQYPGVDYLRVAAEIAEFHHERFNGTGYPAGLKGKEIPLSARIVALADVYDAITSKRVYKEAFTHHAARAMILDERGKHFDPEVVDAFVQVESQMMEIAATMTDSRLGMQATPSALVTTPQPVAATSTEEED